MSDVARPLNREWLQFAVELCKTQVVQTQGSERDQKVWKGPADVPTPGSEDYDSQ